MKPGILNTAFSLLLFFSFTSHSIAQDKASNWPNAITYEIFVQSFADSDNDSIGDFNGMASKLDYLKDLGIEAIWLMPIHPSNTYHKYNVDDYYNVHPDYGTLQDFKNFVDEAHKRNIRIVIDLVINHSGRGNIWFTEAVKDPNSKYWDYYVWAHKDDPRVQPPAGQKRSNWYPVKGSDYLYFAHFGSNMPDLNYDNPKLREEIFKIGKFWLTEMNVDGFRLDAARHIYPDERPADMYKWWEYFLQEMKKIKQDIYIVGEVWTDVSQAAPYLKGIPALFDFDMAAAIINALNEENGEKIAPTHKKILDAYKSIRSDYIDNTFLANHDQNRILSSVKSSLEKAKLAASILLTLPGSPYLYYGEEIGMIGEKPDPYIREPFLWDIKSKDKIRPSWEIPRFSTDATVRPLALQVSDKNSIYNHYRRLIGLRNSSSALTNGELEPVAIPDSSISAFVRSAQDQSLLVIHNLSGSKKIITLPDHVREYGTIFFPETKNKVKNGQVEIPGYSTIILAP